MNRIIGPLAALLCIAFATPMQADHGCNGTITKIDVGSETWYLDDRSTQLGEVDHWLYLESNGVAGLQSGGTVDIIDDSVEPELTDPCAHDDPDRLVI